MDFLKAFCRLWVAAWLLSGTPAGLLLGCSVPCGLLLGRGLSRRLELWLGHRKPAGPVRSTR